MDGSTLLIIAMIGLGSAALVIAAVEHWARIEPHLLPWRVDLFISAMFTVLAVVDAAGGRWLGAALFALFAVPSLLAALRALRRARAS